MVEIFNQPAVDHVGQLLLQVLLVFLVREQVFFAKVERRRHSRLCDVILRRLLGPVHFQVFVFAVVVLSRRARQHHLAQVHQVAEGDAADVAEAVVLRPLHEPVRVHAEHPEDYIPRVAARQPVQSGELGEQRVVEKRARFQFHVLHQRSGNDPAVEEIGQEVYVLREVLDGKNRRQGLKGGQLLVQLLVVRQSRQSDHRSLRVSDPMDLRLPGRLQNVLDRRREVVLGHVLEREPPVALVLLGVQVRVRLGLTRSPRVAHPQVVPGIDEHARQASRVAGAHPRAGVAVDSVLQYHRKFLVLLPRSFFRQHSEHGQYVIVSGRHLVRLAPVPIVADHLLRFQLNCLSRLFCSSGREPFEQRVEKLHCKF